jgi:anti-sigma B factor antagonist
MELLTKTVSFPESLDDASVAGFYQDVDAAIASSSQVILVNFKEVEFISSPSLMALVVAFKRAREANKKLLLCSINTQVRMLLELTGMDGIFEVTDALDETDAPELATV